VSQVRILLGALSIVPSQGLFFAFQSGILTTPDGVPVRAASAGAAEMAASSRSDSASRSSSNSDAYTSNVMAADLG
jgi:hypothetical protein